MKREREKRGRNAPKGRKIRSNCPGRVDEVRRGK